MIKETKKLKNMKICKVGELVILFHHKKKQVEIKLIDEKCNHTLTHFVDFEDWEKLAKIKD